MQLSLFAVYRALSAYEAHILVSNRDQTAISAVCRLRGAAHTFHPDILYVAMCGEMPARSTASIPNLLLIHRTDAPKHTPPLSAVNLLQIRFDGTEEEILSQVRGLLARESAESDYDRLLDAACAGDPQQFAETVYQLWGNPVFSHDTSYRFISRCMGNNAAYGYYSREYYKDTVLAQDSVQFIRAQKFIERAAREKRPFFGQNTNGEQTLFIPVFNQDILIAHFAIFASNTVMDQRDLPWPRPLESCSP